MPLATINNILRDESDKLFTELKRLRNREVLAIIGPIDRFSVSLLYDLINRKLAENISLQKVDVIIDSVGGDIDAAYHLAKLLSQIVTEELVFIVPRMAKSAATLLVCGGDEIIMHETSELGPLDPQIRLEDSSFVSGLSVRSALDLIDEQAKKGNIDVAKMLTNKLSPLHLGEIDRALNIGENYLSNLLVQRMLKEKRENKELIAEITTKLAKGYTHHSYIIDYEEAKDLGLRVRKFDDKEWTVVWQIYSVNQKLANLQQIQNTLAEHNTLKKFIKRKNIR